MECPYCEKTIEKGAFFCSQCGHLLPEEPEQPKETDTQKETDENYVSLPKERNFIPQQREEEPATPESEFTFASTGENLAITKYKGNRERVIVPDNFRGRKIVEIRDGAFRNNKNLKYLRLPRTIKKIKWQAFYNCKNLEIIDFGYKDPVPGVAYFPPEIEEIREHAFCPSMFREVNICKSTKLKSQTGIFPSLKALVFGFECVVFTYE